MIELKIYFRKSDNKPLPYNYYKNHHGFVSKLIGNDSYGEAFNNYTYSNLHGSRYEKNGISFKNNVGYFFIRTNNNNTLVNFFQNYDKMKNEEMYYGIYLDGFEISFIDKIEKSRFKTMVESPILVNGSYAFKNKDWFDDEDILKCENYIVNNISEKAKSLNFTIDENLSIKIKNQGKHSDITYGGVHNKGRVFDLEIKCNNETKEFILLNGIGLSCGCGFGMIY